MKFLLYPHNKTRQAFVLLSILTLIASTTSCKKAWLDAKPNKNLVVPSSIADYQAILDNNTIFNSNGVALGQASCDDSYITDNSFSTLDIISKNAYIWASDIFDGNPCDDWKYAYQRILDANIVLDGINKVYKSDLSAWENVKGSALFYRAFDYFNLSQVFCKPYFKESANTDLGLPIRLTANINDIIKRSTVEQTYNRIIDDVTSALSLLPDLSIYKTRPSKWACYALLARVYLSMNDFENAGQYADSCLTISNKLMDYNNINASQTYPITALNDEVIFHSTLLTYFSTFVTTAIVDSTLYGYYKDNDLRKTIYFRDFNGAIRLWGNYAGTIASNFGGLATDEVYLTRAECRVRMGDIVGGLADLNTLLRTRYTKNLDGSSSYIDQTADSKETALELILKERRKELLYRGIRWMDLRRLNQDSRYAVTLKRVIAGQTYTLKPNANLYTLPIPPDELKLSGIEQNPR